VFCDRGNKLLNMINNYITTTPVQTGPGAHPASCTMGTGSFPGVGERPERDADPLLPSSAVGHERVELYLYSPYGPYGLYRASVPVQGVLFTYFTSITNQQMHIYKYAQSYVVEFSFIPSCIPDGHPHRVTNNKCRIDTVISPDDGHIVARNTYRKEINILKKLCNQIGFIYKMTRVVIL